MSDIFICYSRTDHLIASQLAAKLRAACWSVFIDVQTPVSKRWQKGIECEMHLLESGAQKEINYCNESHSVNAIYHL